jgi:integrase/recombinase XerD
MPDRGIDGLLEQLLQRDHRMELGQLMGGYRLCARAEGKSDSYITLVTSAVKYLKRHLEVTGLPMQVNEITADIIRGFILHLQSTPRFAGHPFARTQEAGLSGHCINTYLRSIRAFWHWLESEDLITDNPFNKVKIPKPPHKIIPTFSDEQLKLLFSQPNRSSATGFRDYTLMLVLLDTLMRVSELIGCLMEDLNIGSRVIKVMGKGSKERVVPFGKTTQKVLWKYTTVYRPEPHLPQHNRLFLTSEGRPLTKNRVEAIVKKYGERAGIQGVRVSPHTFRHSGAVAFLRNGGDLFTLQRIMGHSSLEILRRYVNLNLDDLRRIHAKASPLDNLSLPAIRATKSVK